MSDYLTRREKEILKNERKQKRKNVGMGLIALGVAGFAVSLVSRDRKIERLTTKVLERVKVSPKADSMHIVHALVRTADHPLYIGGPGILFPVGGGRDYDERKGQLTILQTKGTYSTKYKEVFLQTDEPKYVTWKDEFPLNKIPRELNKEFQDHERFEVKRSVNPAYFCPKTFLASDNVFALSRNIAALEVGYIDKRTLAATSLPIVAGVLTLCTTF
ncbi:hypothetical protein [Brazilian marseillevirus]|uniref:hypothetical protein n=1 Tax=Brazilian marseillevirus TaxID=1813599 RepID=UPI000783FF87|nr:hypothetical protein A3303_gp407 [Brazilian marseillevirus]AMQ10915.1 hypothetical protein [Brazilian marseillevirus]